MSRPDASRAAGFGAGPGSLRLILALLQVVYDQRVLHDFETGQPNQLLSQLHDIGIFLSFYGYLQDFECASAKSVVSAREVGWQR